MNDNMIKIREKKKFKENILNEVEKRITTIIIGSLDSFEKKFGKLWGHGIEDPNQMKNHQLHNRPLWTEVRKDILDKSNKQKRELMNYIAKLRIMGD